MLKVDEDNAVVFDSVPWLHGLFRGITGDFQPITTWRGK